MPAEPMPTAGDDVEELRRQVEALRLENAVMRETIGVLKADDCVGGGAVFLDCDPRRRRPWRSTRGNSGNARSSCM